MGVDFVGGFIRVKPTGEVCLADGTLALTLATALHTAISAMLDAGAGGGPGAGSFALAKTAWELPAVLPAISATKAKGV